MGKPFEITYSPAAWSAPPGGVAQQWASPYGGLNVQSPENMLDPSFTPAMSNFMFRNSELRSRPALQRLFPGPDGTNAILGLGSFLSPNLIWHTFAFTITGLYQLDTNGVSKAVIGQNPWVKVGGPALPSNFVSWRTFRNVLYYTNGSAHLSAWDGQALTPLTDVAATGATFPIPSNYTGTTFGGLYLGELDQHLILGYTTEATYSTGALTGTQTFPQRIRWSNVAFNLNGAGTFGSNLGTTAATFDPTINVNAGFNDFIDVPDIVTGMMFVGRFGYLFRQNGITEMSPTGQGTAPFDFNHLWAAQNGVGNVYPASIAQYGLHGAFVAFDNIYHVTPGNFEAIGGGARDAIMADLAAATAPPSACITYAFNQGYNYLVYMLFIGNPDGTTHAYVYSFEEKNWALWQFTNQGVGVATNCWVGN